MIAAGNVDENLSEKKMESEDGLRTMECLRGRLLAERVTSKVAKEDAEQMGNKLIELEKQLKTEIKSRNKAEKKLKFLLKKLESMNISYVSEESEHSSLSEKSEISFVSSTDSSSTKKPEDKESITQIKNFPKCDGEESLERTEVTSSQIHFCPSNEETLSGTGKADSGKSEEIEAGQKCHDSKNSVHSLKTSIKEEKDQNEDDHVDDSLALVPLDLPKTTQIIDPAILDQTVKDVLDALRHAKEKLQSSMEIRRVIKVGSR